MTREELIKAARICTSKRCKGCPLYPQTAEHAYCVDILIAGLADELENKPKPVNYSGDGYADGELVYDMAECPNCGETYYDGESGWGEPFCPKCGQALDWSWSCGMPEVENE